MRSISPPVLMGDPKFVKTYGPMLGFEFVTPRWRPWISCAGTCRCRSVANLRANPVGLRFKGEYLIKAKSPPYYDSMEEAVDVVMAGSSDRRESTRTQVFAKIYKEDFGDHI